MAAACLVGLLAIAAAIVVVSDRGDESANPPPTPTAGSSSAEPTESATEESAPTCGVTDTSQDLPATTPKDVTWTVWKGAALPSSKSAGPLEADDSTGVTECYARTPLGASMAAINIGYRISLAAPDTTIIDKQVAEGPHKKQFKQTAAGYQKPSEIPQIAGFRVNSYTDTQALVDIAIGDSGGYATSQSSMTWVDGTWKAVATANDAEGTSNWQNIDSLDGYVELKGVG